MRNNYLESAAFKHQRGGEKALKVKKKVEFKRGFADDY